MQPVEICSGLWQWRAPHPAWQPDAAPGSSAYWPREVGCVLYETPARAIVIDPLVPSHAREDFWRWADARCAGREVAVLTTIRFHARSRDDFVERYGASTSRARRNLAPTVRALPLKGAGETMFWLTEPRALVAGDRIIGDGDGGLGLCPDSWLRYLPGRLTNAGLRELLRPLLELPIERVLVSHGESVLTNAHRALGEALA